ncbi:MAG TPA: EAL domain-containing protein, partial [Gallionellaceae bacterium]|nr:EAL domain-containing protein [Gallionellaceae bacterium]
MKQRWDQSILYLTTMAVLTIAVVIGALFIDVANRTTRERIQQQSVQRLGELLDTVESTAAIACAKDNGALAQELTNGLLKNSGVLGAVISNDAHELARSYRDKASKSELENASVSRLVRIIYSPAHPEIPVGEIHLDPDTVQFEQMVQHEVHFVGKLLGVQIAGTAAAIFLVLLIWIVRPIKALSDRLHGMKATDGERLRIPRGHSHTELGRLAEDINALAARLVTTLDEEHRLRLQHEIGEKKYHAIFHNAETGILIVNRDGRIESFNPALARLLELSASHEADGHVRLLMELHWSAPARLDQLISECIDKKSACSSDLEYILKDGSTRWLSMQFSPLAEDRVQGVVSDITERKLAENTARLQIVTDPLTGVANRPGLEQALQAYIRKFDIVSDSGFAMMLINLDGFKRVNEALGLPVGDEVLKVAAKRLNSCLKPSDTVARIGGDEYVVVLPRATDEGVTARISERIINVLRESYEVHTTPIHLGVSIGIAFFPDDGRDIPTLLRNAELAMSRAKAAGGNRFTFFNLGMAEAAEQRRTLETDMHQALRRDEFRLFLQPIVDISSKRLVGAEALIRWHHPVNGIVSPDTFIPLAEETGLIVDIGRWVLEAACKQLLRWQSEGLDYYLSINISGRQIPDGLSPATLIEAVRRHGVEPRQLVLEITEGMLLSDVGKALSWLNAVSEAGFRIYLDDFGTGYSSLSYLKRFPVNTVKIDKSFVRDMGSNSSDLALVGAIIAMAHSLNLDVVAEGVENLAQLQLLSQMHCGSIQGYYFSRPV